MNYVIAGNFKQCRALAREQGWTDRDFKFCNDPQRMRGLRFRPGDTWWITGTPWDNPHYHEILEQKHIMEFVNE